jgi:hypothetical protein
MGLAAFITARKNPDQAPLVKAFILLTLAFMAGRILGLMFDDLGPMQTYAEITFEIFWASVGVFVLRRGSKLTQRI